LRGSADNIYMGDDLVKSVLRTTPLKYLEPYVKALADPRVKKCALDIFIGPGQGVSCIAKQFVLEEATKARRKKLPTRLRQLTAKLKINHPDRFRRFALWQIARNRLLINYAHVYDKRPLAVVIAGRFDQDDAINKSLATNVARYSVGYRTVFYEVGTDDAAINSVMNATSAMRASVLYFDIHGGRLGAQLEYPYTASQKISNALRTRYLPMSLWGRRNRPSSGMAMRGAATLFDHSTLLDVMDGKKLARLKDRLVTGAIVHANVCSTAMGGLRFNNWHNQLADTFKTADVYGINGIGGTAALFDYDAKFIRIAQSPKVRSVVANRSRGIYHIYDGSRGLRTRSRDGKIIVDQRRMERHFDPRYMIITPPKQNVLSKIMALTTAFTDSDPDVRAAAAAELLMTHAAKDDPTLPMLEAAKKVIAQAVRKSGQKMVSNVVYDVMHRYSFKQREKFQALSKKAISLIGPSTKPALKELSQRRRFFVSRGRRIAVGASRFGPSGRARRLLQMFKTQTSE